MSAEPEYALMLDVVAPLARPRTDFRAWGPSRWGQVLNIADWHRLSPALFTHLQSAGGAPPALLSGLERAYLASSARSLFIRASASQIVSALEAVRAEPMLLKGAALVETVYGDPARREMLDIDVLVRPDRHRDATAALAELGYSTSGDGGRTLAAISSPAGLLITPHHDAAMVGPDRLVAVELHRHITIAEEGRGLELAGLWERSRTVPDTGHRIPSAEDLLIHVCFHFTRNRLGGSAQRRNTGGALAQILDMNLLIERKQIDWDRIVRTARESGLATRVFLGLFAARELGVEVPVGAIAPLRPAGFDPELGRRLVALRVLRAGEHMPVRSMRWMIAPSREALRRGWNADPNATLSLARAYMRRAQAHVPEARAAVRRPWVYVQDRRLNGQIEALEERA